MTYPSPWQSLVETMSRLTRSVFFFTLPRNTLLKVLFSYVYFLNVYYFKLTFCRTYLHISGTWLISNKTF